MRLAQSRYADVSATALKTRYFLHMQKARRRLSHGPFQELFDGLMRRLRLLPL